MEQLEMVEKLHVKAGVTYDEARDALVRAEWDMLEAVRILEQEGRIAPLSSSMTTFEENTKYEEVRATADPGRKSSGKFWDKVCEVFAMLCTREFQVARRGEVIVRLPLIVAIVIFFGMFKVTVAALFVGLFCDCKYSVEK